MKILKNRMVLGIACIVFSLLICFVVTPLFQGTINGKTQIVRIRNNITAGQVITKEDVELVEVGSYNLPMTVVKEEAQVIDRYATSDLIQGDYVLEEKISETPQEMNAYLYQLDGSKQAISVSIKTFAAGLSGKLESGDIVSVISPNHKSLGTTVIPEELKYVEVISVTADTGADTNQVNYNQETEEEQVLPSTITLLVTEEQSKVLAELELEGEIHISLVYRGTEKNKKQFLDVQNETLEKLYNPKPEGSESSENTEESSEIREKESKTEVEEDLEGVAE